MANTMSQQSDKDILSAILAAYELGVACAKAVNGPRGWTPTRAKRERAALDRLFRQLCGRTLTDDEYAAFCN